ncbi:STM4015 family protein [Streptomyces sp. NPDC020141]|uniref:STM4015 family protein n=1 Tax=Streptomyces sp. NPDC020141 TaxID=3365065 RepID=UPI003791C713
MTISDHLQELHGLPVFDFPEAGVETELPPASTVAWRVEVDEYARGEQEEWTSAFARFVASVDTSEVRALIVGMWLEPYENGPEPVVEALTAAAERFPALRALFIGDITYEQCEISWITQGDVTPLLDAYPRLLEFGVRGGQSLVFPAVRHDRLRSLTVESGGLDQEVVRGIAASELPALERLDLWLGDSGYGATAGVSDLEPLLGGGRLPRLRHLALRNSDMQDRIAVALAGAPVVARLESLDLSMGTLGDEGAEALLGGQPLTHLKKLDLHHHFIGAPMRKRLATALEAAGAEVDLSGEQGDDADGRGHRYVAVAE